jgi:hypothetical protein
MMLVAVGRVNVRNFWYQSRGTLHHEDVVCLQSYNVSMLPGQFVISVTALPVVYVNMSTLVATTSTSTSTVEPCIFFPTTVLAVVPVIASYKIFMGLYAPRRNTL